MRTFRRKRHAGRGFTLAELIVAMAVTVILLGLLVSVTGVALDGWRMSRNKVRAARQAKAALEQISRDFESMVARSGNIYEWLYTESDPNEAPGPGDGVKSRNAARMIFFTAATDRYDGRVGPDSNNPGDVSAVGYRLVYKDPITDSDDDDYSVFVLYRRLVDPREGGEGSEEGAFYDLLAQEDLEAAFEVNYGATVEDSENFICENIFEMSVVFTIEYMAEAGGSPVARIQRVPVLATKKGPDAVSEFRLKGDGIVADGNAETDYADGRIVAVDVSISVLTDNGVATLRRDADLEGDRLADFLARNSYRFSKTIMLPQP